MYGKKTTQTSKENTKQTQEIKFSSQQLFRNLMEKKQLMINMFYKAK
jgi:hypothetical protein